MPETKRIDDRATSAGYRFPIPRVPSAYHSNCVPAASLDPKHRTASRSAPPGTSAGRAAKNYSEADFAKCDEVTQDRIWREAVNRETQGVNKWEEGWGFMKDYDQRGELKEKEDLPDNLTRFSDKVPNTTNQSLGHRQSTGAARAMVQLQHQLSIGHQKKHHAELVYGAE